MRADKVGRDTLLSQIVQMVADAQRSRAPIQRLADQVAGWFVPTVIVVALIAFAAWAWFGPEPRMAFGLVAAVSVLIIACPCALGLATPMSIMVGVGRGAQAGVLIKNAEALERMEKIDTLVVDKTGTLTEGKPKVVAIVAAAGFAGSRHPAAGRQRRARQRASAGGRDRARRQGAQSRPEQGAMNSIRRPAKARPAKSTARAIAAGQRELSRIDSAIETQPLHEQSERLRGDGATVIYIAVDGKLAGLFAIADPVKASTPDALKALAAEGIKVIMLTGDNRTTANAVARTAWDCRCRGGGAAGSEERGGRKAAEGRARRRDGRRRRQRRPGAGRGRCRHRHGHRHGCGDGKRRRSRCCKGDLGGIVRARRLSQATMRNIRQNLFFAFVYNAAGIPIAAGILYPAFGLLLSPIIAAAAMALSSVSVVGNALRLRVTRL